MASAVTQEIHKLTRTNTLEIYTPKTEKENKMYTSGLWLETGDRWTEQTVSQLMLGVAGPRRNDYVIC